MEESSLKEKIEQYFRQQCDINGDIVLSKKIEQIIYKDGMSKIKNATEDRGGFASEQVSNNAGNNSLEAMSKRMVPGGITSKGVSSGENISKIDLNSVTTDWFTSESLKVLNEKICNCMCCELGSTRTKLVFGSGNPNADIVVIGEAPGADEDKQGFPFVGAAGQLLTKILAAVNFQRDEVYICNILKCRPPNNRTPEPNEVQKCEPYLLKQLEIIKPKFILALGLTAANTLLKQKSKMMDLRGTTHSYNDIPMVVTYHPAALLRNPNWKRATWEDVQELRRMYDASK